MVDEKQLLKNIPKIYILGAARMFLIIMPVIVPYFQSIGLSMSQIYQLQAVFSLTVLIFELPSGYAADLLGRKRSLIVSLIFTGIGFSLIPFATSFGDFVIFEILLGIGLSLYSGTDVALLYDTYESINKNAPAKLLGGGLYYTQIGETIASLIGGALVYVSLQMPAIVNAFTGWIPLLIALTIVEPPRKLMNKKKHWDNVTYIYRSLFAHSKLLTMIIFNNVFFSAATLVAVWVFQDYWNDIGIPLTYFGILWALMNLIVAIAAKWAHVIEFKIGSGKSLILIWGGIILGYWGMGYIGTIFGVIFCLLFQMARGVGQIILRDGLNRRVSADMRATANSVCSLGVRIVFMVCGPLMGWLIDTKGQQVAFHAFAYGHLIVMLVLLIPLFAQRKSFIVLRD